MIVATLATSRTDQALLVAVLAGSAATMGDSVFELGPDASSTGVVGTGKRALYAFWREENVIGQLCVCSRRGGEGVLSGGEKKWSRWEEKRLKEGSDRLEWRAGEKKRKAAKRKRDPPKVFARSVGVFGVKRRAEGLHLQDLVVAQGRHGRDGGEQGLPEPRERVPAAPKVGLARAKLRPVLERAAKALDPGKLLRLLCGCSRRVKKGEWEVIIWSGEREPFFSLFSSSSLSPPSLSLPTSPHLRRTFEVPASA